MGREIPNWRLIVLHEDFRCNARRAPDPVDQILLFSQDSFEWFNRNAPVTWRVVRRLLLAVLDERCRGRGIYLGSLYVGRRRRR